MFRLAHLSDIHLAPLPPVRLRDLASKRITGYINWKRNRSQNLGNDILSRLCTDLKQENPDHTVLTGDLVNLALDAEIEAARVWLEAFGHPREISVVPGNHDAYVPGALKKVKRAWLPWMNSDEEQDFTFPYMRVRGNIAIIGVSSAIATAPFMASGDFSNKQAKRLERMLVEAGERHLYRVVLIHHPPLKGATSRFKRLHGISRFQNTVLSGGAELVLHGHTHLPTLDYIKKGKANIPVACVPAAGQAPGGSNPAAGYSIFEIDGEAGSWRTTMIRRTMLGTTTGFSQTQRLEL